MHVNVAKDSDWNNIKPNWFHCIGLDILQSSFVFHRKKKNK